MGHPAPRTLGREHQEQSRSSERYKTTTGDAMDTAFFNEFQKKHSTPQWLNLVSSLGAVDVPRD